MRFRVMLRAARTFGRQGHRDLFHQPTSPLRVEFFEGEPMKNAAWVSIIVALALTDAGNSAKAGLCGLWSYRCCPTESCAACGDYCAAKSCCAPCCKTVTETVWEKQQVTCCKTVYDRVCEQVPYTCMRNVYDTCYRDVCCTVCKPCYQTCYKPVCYTVCKPCYQTCYRTCCYTICKPCYQTCYRTCCYTVCKPCYQTCYRDVCCTTYKTESQTCYRDCCYTCCKPVVEKKMVPVCCGEWKTVTETVPGAVMDQCQCDPGCWEWDPCTCCCVYRPGCCRMVKVQCPPTTCCRQVWVEKTVQQEVCCTRYETEVKHVQVPYTVCRQVPCTTTQRVPYTVCTYTQQVCHKQIPYTVCTMHQEVCHKTVPYTVCTYTQEVCH